MQRKNGAWGKDDTIDVSCLEPGSAFVFLEAHDLQDKGKGIRSANIAVLQPLLPMLRQHLMVDLANIQSAIFIRHGLIYRTDQSKIILIQSGIRQLIIVVEVGNALNGQIKHAAVEFGFLISIRINIELIAAVLQIQHRGLFIGEKQQRGIVIVDIWHGISPFLIFLS